MAEISIIIPCYNVENYIDRCLDSIVSQTIGLSMLEVITVNDASTDHTLEKLYQWEKRFPETILVISYEENLRQGGARNIGLEYAAGEYVGFVDADDWIEKDMYALLHEKIDSGHYDIVKCKFIREHEPNEIDLTPFSHIRQDAEYTFPAKGGLYYGKVSETGNAGEYGSMCTGLYRKNLFADHALKFPEHLAYEDNYLESLLTLFTHRLYIIDKILYHYFINPVSTTTAVNASHQLDRLTIALLTVDAFKQYGAFNLYHDEIEWEFIQKFYLNTWYIIFTRFSYIPDIFPDMKEKILSLFPDYKLNPYLSQANMREQQLLRLLELDTDLSPDILEKIKQAYLSTF